jgi:hypothetical protein
MHRPALAGVHHAADIAGLHAQKKRYTPTTLAAELVFTENDRVGVIPTSHPGGLVPDVIDSSSSADDQSRHPNRPALQRPPHSPSPMGSAEMDSYYSFLRQLGSSYLSRHFRLSDFPSESTRMCLVLVGIILERKTYRRRLLTRRLDPKSVAFLINISATGAAVWRSLEFRPAWMLSGYSFWLVPREPLTLLRDTIIPDRLSSGSGSVSAVSPDTVTMHPPSQRESSVSATPHCSTGCRSHLRSPVVRTVA